MDRLCPLCKSAIRRMIETTLGSGDKRNLIGCQNEACAFHNGIDAGLWQTVNEAMDRDQRIKDGESVELCRDLALENGWPEIRLEDGPTWYVGNAYSFNQERNGHKSYDFKEAVRSWNYNVGLF